jgi:uncharacterized protein
VFIIWRRTVGCCCKTKVVPITVSQPLILWKQRIWFSQDDYPLSLSRIKANMEEAVQLKLDDQGHGAFSISEGSQQLGEMVVREKDHQLTVYHTEVIAEAEGKGLAKKMLGAMVDYARSNQLQVVPLCSYVHAQFKRHPDAYTDIWKGDD